MNIRVPVTDTHIRRGKPGSMEHCPVALALREQEGIAKPSVNTVNIGFLRERSRENLRPQPGLASWIARFDDYRAVEPFILVLNLTAGTALKEKP